MKRGGSTIPEKLRAKMAMDPEYKRCSLQGHGPCEGRVTWEHALIYASKKIQERWAIIPLCALHHNVDQFQDAKTMIKDRNVWVALNRATEEELFRFSKVVNYTRERDRLNDKFGFYVAPPIPDAPVIAKAPILRNTRTKPKADEMEREARAFSRESGLSVEAAREYLSVMN
jgi:hypothetical protein